MKEQNQIIPEMLTQLSEWKLEWNKKLTKF